MSDVPDNELYTAQGVLEDAPFGIHVYQLTSDERLILLGSNATASRILGIDHHPFVGKTIQEAFPALVETEIPIRYRAVRLREPMPRQVTGLLAVDRISLEPSRCAAGAASSQAVRPMWLPKDYGDGGCFIAASFRDRSR